VKRKLIAGILWLLCLAVLLPAQAEMRGYARGQGYVYALLGSYPYEKDGTAKPVLWRVLTVENDQALLLTEYIIDTKQIIFETDPKVIENHSFRRIETYAESDLYAWLNSEGIDALLGDEEIRAALIEEPELGLLFPLKQEQYLDEDTYGFSKGQWGEALNAYPKRQAESTPYARANGLYVESGNGKSPYWCVAIKGAKDYKFGLVGYNGHISWGAYTNKKVAGLRLALRLDLSKVEITGGLGTQEQPYTLRYTGETADHTADAAEPGFTQAPEADAAEAKANGTSAVDFVKAIAAKAKQKGNAFMAARQEETAPAQAVAAGAAEDDKTSEDEAIKAEAKKIAEEAAQMMGHSDGMF